MAETTAIAWTDATFNPVIGCTKVGPGCDNCYAELLDRNRFSHTLPALEEGASGTMSRPRVIHWGPGAPRHRTSRENWRMVRRLDRRAQASGNRTSVFCASLADVFDNEWPEGVREQLWSLIEETPHLDWRLLTKRIGNVAKMAPARWMEMGWPAHVSLGITVVTQAEADRDIPKHLDIPVRLHWLSIEPQLEHIDVRMYLTRRYLMGVDALPGIGWVICGGESGPGARPFHLDWARSLRYQCDVARVPFFMKQVGANAHGGPTDERFRTNDRAGAAPEEWPVDLRIQEFPR